HIGRGWFGLERAVERRSLIVRIAGYLISGGQIEPIAGIVGIERDRRSEASDRGLRVAAHKSKVTSQAMAIVGIARREPHRPFELSQLRMRREDAGGELFARQNKIDRDQQPHAGGKLPTL